MAPWTELEDTYMPTIEVDPRTLVPTAKNPRRLGQHERARLVQSMRDWGCLENVVVNRRTGELVSGHQRVAAAIAAGLATIPVHTIAVDAATARQISLHLNRVHGEWDETTLAEVLHDLAAQQADLTATGFTPEELDALLAVTDSRAPALPDAPASPVPEPTAFLSPILDTPPPPMAALPRPPASPYVDLAFAVTVEQRALVLQAVQRAKTRWSVPTSMEALVRICAWFLET